MSGKGQHSGGKHLSLYNRSTCTIDSPLQPLTSRNQTLGVVLLFGDTGAPLHHAHGERGQLSVEPGQLG